MKRILLASINSDFKIRKWTSRSFSFSSKWKETCTKRTRVEILLFRATRIGCFKKKKNSSKIITNRRDKQTNRLAWEKIRFIRSCCNSARICPRIIRFNRNDSRQRLSCLESPHLRGDLRGFPLFLRSLKDDIFCQPLHGRLYEAISPLLSSPRRTRRV